MPTATINPALPPEPEQAWIKPTLSNTFGGKTYQPTHPDLFRVEFTASKGLEEDYASRLVAVRVSIFLRERDMLLKVSGRNEADFRPGFLGFRSQRVDNSPHQHIPCSRKGLLFGSIRARPKRSPRAQL